LALSHRRPWVVVVVCWLASALNTRPTGGALTIDRWRCVAGVGLIVLGYCIKARKEESMLTAHLGQAFTDHCRHTGFLLPKL
jgi:protein-S-isoprenylcysteine O-methyltransferase Ste14